MKGNLHRVGAVVLFLVIVVVISVAIKKVSFLLLSLFLFFFSLRAKSILDLPPLECRPSLFLVLTQKMNESNMSAGRLHRCR